MKTLCTFVSALALAAGALAAQPPDILLLMPDQMRGDCLSTVGHPVVRTPTLDRLTQEGVLFRRAYSTVPSCIPARYALLTGLSPQASGVVGFKAGVHPSQPVALEDLMPTLVALAVPLNPAGGSQAPSTCYARVASGVCEIIFGIE